MEEIIINGIGSELQGVGRLSDGRAVFVPAALPEERVRIQIEHDGGRFCEASLCDVLSPSPERIAPSCPHFGSCGGCQAQHMRYAYSLELKKKKVSDALIRIGHLEDPKVLDTLGCLDPERTRNKAEFPIGFVNGKIAMGAYALGSHSIIPLSDCRLQASESIAVLRWMTNRLPAPPCANHLKYLVTRINRAGELMVILCGDAPILSEMENLAREMRAALPEIKSFYYCHLNRRFTHALDGKCTRIWGAETLKEQLLGLSFEISPQSFFQVNVLQAEKLYAKALEAVGIRPNCDLRVLDAYCGAGTISLAAARWARHVTGIEIVPPAIENARKNALRNGLDSKARFICGDAAKEIPRLIRNGERFDAAILDPPRKGADAGLLKSLIDAHIPAIAYVSCNPATLARDLQILVKGGYDFEWAQPVDMFPWTSHVETVALLTREPSDTKKRMQVRK